MTVGLGVEGARQAIGSYSKLRPGPGREAADVAAHQCARLHAAVIELAAERSYESIAIRDLTSVAKVSSRAFYKQFSGKQACFESAHEMVSHRLDKRVRAAEAAEQGPAQRLRRIVSSFLVELARDPGAARLFLVEPYAAGETTQAQTRRTVRTLEEAIARSFASAPDEPVPPPLVIGGIALGIERIARSRLIAGRESELPHIAEPLSSWALLHRSTTTPVLAEPGWVGVPGDDSTRLPPALLSGTQREEEGSSSSRGDRALLLSAVTRLAASQDYRNLTVSLACTAAGVSRPRFYAHFEGIEDCLLAALEVRIREIFSQAKRAVTCGRNWADGASRTVAGTCFEIVADPTFAGLLLSPTAAAVDWGVLGIEQRECLLASITNHVCRETPQSSVQRLEVEASIEAAWGLLRSQIASGGAGQVPGLAGAMAVLILTPIVGAKKASAAVEAKADVLLSSAPGRALARVA